MRYERQIAYGVLLAGFCTLQACNKQQAPDASGTLEAVEVMVPAQVGGILESFEVEEGQQLQAGQALGHIDSLQLSLRRRQLLAQVQAVLSRLPNVGVQTGMFSAQMAALQVQVENLKRDRSRLQVLLKAEAATQKQLDDVETQLRAQQEQLSALQRQYDAQRSVLTTQQQGLLAEVAPLQAQLAQVDDQIARCRLVSPMKGTVLLKYMEVYEMAQPGKPLFMMADLSALDVRAYVTADQLSGLKLGQACRVLVDSAEGGQRALPGTLRWVSSMAEFTPKTIQTRKERANLVYAVKVRVKNDGTLKLGQYADVDF